MTNLFFSLWFVICVLIRLTHLPETHAYLQGESGSPPPFPTVIDGCNAVFAANSARKWSFPPSWCINRISTVYLMLKPIREDFYNSIGADFPDFPDLLVQLAPLLHLINPDHFL